MITLHTQTTPNGRKPLILMEEIGADYHCRFVDLAMGEQKSPAFLKINPNGKIPVLVDDAGPDDARHVVFESGAILVYLAERFRSPLWPDDLAARSTVLQWLMFQMAAIGPMFGQAGYFNRSAPEPQPLALARFQSEAERLLGVLERRLDETAYLGGTYSIADIATYPWIAVGSGFAGVDLAPFPNVRRWLEAISARPAVVRAMALCS